MVFLPVKYDISDTRTHRTLSRERNQKAHYFIVSMMIIGQ